MSEVKKIATRDSYGNALAELGKEHENLVVLDADLAAHLYQVSFEYVDGVEHEATLMNVLMAPTGAGKSCVNAPISTWISLAEMLVTIPFTILPA